MLSPTGALEQPNDLHLTKISKRTAKLRKAIETPRAARAKHLAVADWCNDHGMARVVTPRGNCMQSMGFYEHGVQWLFPEEAVYLTDRAQLDFRVDGVPASLQRAWSLMLEGPNAITLDEYCAFAHLRRIGYVVRRPNLDKITNCFDEMIADSDSLHTTQRHISSESGDGASEGEGNPEASPMLKISFSVWRVGAFKRKDTHRPLFNLLVWRYADPPPRHAQLATLLDSCSGRTRLRAALIDRGVVVLIDIANNATPLSSRYIKRLPLVQDEDTTCE